MKKVTFSITVVVLLAMIVGLIGYDRFQQVKTLKNTNQKKNNNYNKRRNNKNKNKKGKK